MIIISIVHDSEYIFLLPIQQTDTIRILFLYCDIKWNKLCLRYSIWHDICNIQTWCAYYDKNK